MGQLREANERLIVAAVRAQDRSDEAHVEAAQAKTELDDLIRHLRDANERLAAATMRAHTMAEEATRREEAYRRLSGRLLYLQDDERRRIAADLHDSMGQRLAALVMNLDLLAGAEEALHARSRQVLMESRSLAEQCVQEVRTMAYLLHPPLFEEMGLVSAVRWYVDWVHEAQWHSCGHEPGRDRKIATADRNGSLPRRTGKSHERPSSRVNVDCVGSSDEHSQRRRARYPGSRTWPS